MTNKRALEAAAVAVVILGATAIAAAPAQAKGRPGVRASGSCSLAGVWELKAKPDDGRLEVEFEVDTNRAGQTWQVRITDNGQLVARRSARTVAPSGSFTVHARPANRAGADVIRAVGVRGDNTCSATVRL